VSESSNTQLLIQEDRADEARVKKIIDAEQQGHGCQIQRQKDFRSFSMG